MKKFLLFSLFSFFFITFKAQTAVSIANGNWTNPLTWNCTCVPINGYSVTISNSVTLNTSLLFSTGGITINNTGSLIQDASLNRDIWINGGYLNNSGKANFRYLLVSLGSLTNPGSFTVSALTNSVSVLNAGSITMDSMYIAGSFTNAANAKIIGDSMTNATTLINNGRINVTWVTNKGIYKNYDYQGSFAYTNAGNFENYDSLILSGSVWNKSVFVNKAGAKFNMTKTFYNNAPGNVASFDNSGAVRVFDSWYNTDTVKGSNTGVFTVSDTSANSGVMKGNFQFCDLTPPTSSPYVDFNTGSIAGTITYCAPAGIKENSISSFNVYPNPSQGVLYLATNYSVQNIHVVLEDMNGRIVCDEKISSLSETTAIQLDCADGLYLLKISGNDQPLQTRKLLIQK